MQPLEKSLRGTLERTVKEARDVAEAAANAALNHLGVMDTAPPSHLGEEERGLRRRLRAHGRQLGDMLNGGKVRTMDRLVEEVAYEHWHRMLFARFLAENNLLMYPDPDAPVAVTLEECEDLAAEEGAANGWELAARFASRMLPQIFRLDSPVFQLVLPPEHQQALERLVAELPTEVFTASDSLGWVYQFWQAKRKDEVNASEVKIGARELPAVTQLFTEPYMVSFLLDNSLGAWWAARRLSDEDLRTAKSEEELRHKASIPGVPLEYLRFVQDEDGVWAPAAGTFDKWPENLSELKTLDPCCGSGHFLVAAFLMLVPMRMELEGLSAKDAVDAVLRENIHGLELDQRCVELAAFALALTAWSYPGAGGYRVLPELNLACSGLSVGANKEQWVSLAPPQTKLRNALDLLYDEFKQAPLLGSLLNSSKSIAANLVEMDELAPALQDSLSNEHDLEGQEIAVAAQGLAKSSDLLNTHYQLIITNVPYLARSKQSPCLRDFCKDHYPSAQNDIATVFVSRCLELCSKNGSVSLVLPQNWLFLTSYKEFRKELLQKYTWNIVSRLGPGAFDTISGEVVKAILISISRDNNLNMSLGMLNETRTVGLISCLDVSESRTSKDKADKIISNAIIRISQKKQLNNPDSIITFESSANAKLLGKYAEGVKGISTSDDPVFVRFFWERMNFNDDWESYQTTTNCTKEFSGYNLTIRFENGKGMMRALAKSQSRDRRMDMRGQSIVGKHGVAISCTGILPVSLFSGTRFDTNVSMVVPSNKDYLASIWCFCASSKYNEAVRQIDQSLKVTNATLVKVPFDLDHWAKVAEEKYPNGLPKPYTDDPTQWIFHGHPCGSVVWDENTKWTSHGPLRTDDTVLHIAVARLLGYRWPAELDEDMELAEEQREWVRRCDTLLPYADEDGIVCIPPVRGEASAADRLLTLLAAAYGDAWASDTLSQLLQNADHAGKTLETWLRDKFFSQHCKLFQHRPFIWHIWDGLRDGFSVLVNYHKLDYKNLETLIYTYLGDWISRQRDDINSGVDGAEERLAAAEQLKKKLELILKGEAPHDIFVRWKPIEEQPMGWNPDLNDGVRLNIRPFMTVGDIKKKGAGILREKPNIKWDKDRGKDVESAPWYPLFKGDRINDHHLSLAEKSSARKR